MTRVSSNQFAAIEQPEVSGNLVGEYWGVLQPPTSYPKSASVSYNASTRDEAVDRLVERYGDCLQEIDPIDKLNLLAILSTWQALDTMGQNDPEEYETCTMTEAAGAHPVEISDALEEVLTDLENISDEAAFHLMVAISNQLVAEQKA